MTEVTLSVDRPPPLRQMTAVLLRQYVDAHWSAATDKFVPPEVTDNAKASIRRMLPEGLKDASSKVGYWKL